MFIQFYFWPVENMVVENGNPLELILCIMPQQDNKRLYATVKRLCELNEEKLLVFS